MLQQFDGASRGAHHRAEFQGGELARLFVKAHALAGARRARYVAAVRQRSSALEAELSSLLAASASSRGFLEAPPSVSESSDPVGSGAATPAAVGPWRLLELVGRGGTSDVYAAEHTATARRAALKIGLGRGAQKGSSAREVAILRRLSHPAVPRLYGSGVAASGHYIAMELVDGKPLTEHCDSVRADLPERLRLFGDLCRAVSYLHGRGVVHCDIKPSNVLVDGDGRVRLIDFGIAVCARRSFHAGRPPYSWTREYAAPEQLRGEPLSPATDIYALGVLLFELLVGHRPWRSSPHPFGHLLDFSAPRPPPRIGAASLAGSLGGTPARRLERVIAKCLAAEPGQRYGCGGALATALARLTARWPRTPSKVVPPLGDKWTHARRRRA